MRFIGLLAMTALLAACADHHNASLTNNPAAPPVRDNNRSTFSDVPAAVEPAAAEAQTLRNANAGDPPGGPAPEPGTILLVGSGLVALGLLRRRGMMQRAHDRPSS